RALVEAARGAPRRLGQEEGRAEVPHRGEAAVAARAQEVAARRGQEAGRGARGDDRRDEAEGRGVLGEAGGEEAPNVEGRPRRAGQRGRARAPRHQEKQRQRRRTDRARLNGDHMDTIQSGTKKLPILNNKVELDVDAELKQFELEQMAALGLEPGKEHWRDDNPTKFTATQRAHTTILISGLTMAHDFFLQGALRGVGYKVKAIDCPDQVALQFGKEFGNRGQCNPTYFTVGNLIKYLTYLRDEQKMPVAEIVANYVFVTAGACGPCRFGTYVTEYRKALRDSGFDGFRVLLFQQQGGLKQATGEEQGLKMDPKFFISLLKAILVGDVLNAIGYRIRPYEVEPGSTNAALEASKKLIHDAFEDPKHKSLFWALVQTRRNLMNVKVDRTIIKPKVSIIGEFWAMTTEGDGNYGLQKFLEQEGAECDVQLVTAWILFMIWEQRWDTQQRMVLRGEDTSRKGLAGKNVRKKLIMLWVAEKAVRGIFQGFANLMGLHDYHLPDMNKVAETAADYYNNHLRGGEGHMEVGKLIMNVAQKKATMTLSVKPFGCMPSSGVSDGVQSM